MFFNIPFNWRNVWFRSSFQHADMVMLGLIGLAIVLAVIPFKYLIMTFIFHSMIMTSKLGKHIKNDQGERRLKEWWDSIPPTPVRIVDEAPVLTVLPK